MSESLDSTARPHEVLEPVYDWDGFGFDTRQVHAGEFEETAFGLAAVARHLADEA